jgi:hypothetical protein
MEYRTICAGYDLESGFYFVIDSELRVVAEAKSLSALWKKLAPLELTPKLSPIYAACAPEFSRASRPRTAPSARRLNIGDIPKHQRRGR